MTATGWTPLAGDPVEDLRVARVHLRMGQLALARAELEDLAGRDVLDTTGLAILAEARWRTGASDAAAEAAAAHLDAGGHDAVAICIAAEAAAGAGRPEAAQSLIERLPLADAPTLDALFAGMPRRAFWPAAPAGDNGLEKLAREAEPRGGGLRSGRAGRDRPLDAPPPTAGPASAPQDRPADRGESAYDDGDGESGGGMRVVPGPREVMEAAGAWADIAAQFASADASARPAGGQRRLAPRSGARLDPRDEIARARGEMGSQPERSLLRLALALRADPTLAPTVLDAIRLRREPAAALLRGDAQRLLGRLLEAEAAFDAAAESLEP